MVKQVRCLHVTSIFCNKIAIASIAIIIYSLPFRIAFLPFESALASRKVFKT